MTLPIVIGALAGLGAIGELLIWQGVRLVPWRRMTLAFLGRVWPDEGCHSPHATMTPASQGRQAPRPGDPPSANGEVRAGATTPAPRGAARAGQATGPAAPGSPPWQPAPLPQPAAGASPLASPGLGQHPFADYRERQPWVTWHQPPSGSLLAIGYEPFHHGPRAVIPDPRVSLRVTGELPALGGDVPALTRRYRADLEKWWDKPVNEP